MRYFRVFLVGLLLLGVFAISNNSDAANWYYVGRSVKKVTYFIDNNSVEKNSQYAKLWIKMGYPNGETNLLMIGVDRRSKQVKNLSAVEYDKFGNIIFSGDLYGPYYPIVPGTIMEDIYAAIW